MEQFDSLISNVRDNPRSSLDNEQIRILLERQREQILADCQAEIRKHECQADYDRRSIQKLNEVIESLRGRVYRAHQGDARLRRDQQLLHERLLEQNRDLREAHEKSLNKMEELKKSQGSTFDSSSSWKLVDYRDTILELTGKIQELQNEHNCMKDARDFQDVFSTQWIIPRYQSTSVFPTSSRSWWNAKPFSGNATKMGRQVFGTHMVYRETFLQIQRRLLQHLIRKRLILVALLCHKTHHHMWWVKAKHQFRHPRCQSGPSAKNSAIPCEGGFSKNYGADQQRLQISKLHFDKFRTPRTFACWKIRLQTEVCTCSQFRTEAMLWIKEVEMVESVDDLTYLRSIKDFQVQTLRSSTRELLQHWTKSSRIPVSRKRSVWRKSQRRPLSPRKTDRLLDLRVLLGHWSQWFCRELCRPIYSCCSKWWYSGIRFEMWRNFYYQWRKSHLMASWKVCTNSEYESLRNSRPYWNCTIWRFIRRKLDLIITDWRQW